MIVDLPRFVETERPHWTALEKTLDWLDIESGAQDSHRGGAAISRAVSARRETIWRGSPASRPKASCRAYLEWLVSRAYAEIHETRQHIPFRPWRWFTVEFPRTFRRHIRAFQMAVALTRLGAAFWRFAMPLRSERQSRADAFRKPAHDACRARRHGARPARAAIDRAEREVFRPN